MSTNMSPFTDVETNASKSRASGKSKKEKCLIASVVILAIIVVVFLVAIILLALVAGKKPASTDSAKPTDPTDSGLHYTHLCTTPGCLSVALDLLNAINPNADPCEDFYQFACGKWSATYSGVGKSKMEAAAITANYDLHDKVSNAILDNDIPAAVKTISAAYILCGSYEDIKEEHGLWLKNKFQDVGGWPMADADWNEKNYHWERNLAQAFHTFGIQSPFTVDVGINVYDTKKHIIMFGQPEMNKLGPFSKENIMNIAKRIGGRNENALENEFKEMDEYAQQLAKISLTADAGEDSDEVKVMTVGEMTSSFPWVNWIEFFTTIFGPYINGTISKSEPILVGGISYISSALKLMFENRVSKRALANYIAAVFIQRLMEVHTSIGTEKRLISHVIKSHKKTSKESHEKTLKLSEPQDFSAVCLNFVSEKASLAVDFIAYRDRKAEIADQKMLSYFSITMKDMIEKASWLDDKTRKAALRKLKAIRYFSGFPDEAKDPKMIEEYFSGLGKANDNVIQNYLMIDRYHFKKEVELLHKEVDFNKWPIGAETRGSQVNAIYFSPLNAVVIPAYMQRDPIFNAERPAFWNFGAFGWIIGHEITHAFDTSGSKKDENGNIRNWWTPEAQNEFDERSKCIIDQYNKIPYGYKKHYVNGTNTIGENVADNGGLRQAYMAYKKWERDHGKEKHLPGLEKYDSDQLFFLSAIQIYCSVQSDPEVIYETFSDDEHSPIPMRFNPAASNFDAFGEAFKCKSASPMNPVKKCVLW